MKKTVLAAAFVAGAAAVSAPPAAAHDPAYACVTTSPTAAVGYVYHPWHSVSIRCYVLGDGVETWSTPTASGWGFAATHGGRAPFTGGGTTLLCAEATTGHGTVTRCSPSGSVDAAAMAGDVVAVTLCSLPPGRYGPVTITGDGDVWVNDEPYWDCPPYQWGQSPSDGFRRLGLDPSPRTALRFRPRTRGPLPHRP